MKIIKPENITVGANLTVNKWISHSDNSWVGDALEVVAIDLPFIVVKEVGGLLDENFSLDVRRVQLQTLSVEYIRALAGDKCDEWVEEII